MSACASGSSCSIATCRLLPSVCPAWISSNEDEDGVEQLPADSVCGFDSALDVWLTSIEFQAACHKKGVDDFDPAQREAYAVEGQKRATAWVNAVQKHSKYKANWQYLHDAFAHFYEDVIEHGMVEWTDDSILEKGNRKQKALKRLIFHTRCVRCPLRRGTVRCPR